MNKIQEIILESDGSICIDSFFKLKIKVIHEITYNELKLITYNDAQKHTYKELKGV